MKKNIITFTSFLLLFVFCIFLLNENIKLKKQILFLTPKNEVVLWSSEKNDCKTNEVLYTISWQSMEPLLKNSEQVKVLDNYYKCNQKVSRWDIIIYASSTTSWDIIKQIRALPWDIIKFENGNMFINGEILKNSIWEKYSFSDKEILLMIAYMQNWVLQDWAFFAFWDNLTNSIDSRKMWWLWINNFKAKVIFEK